ncbi:hypothetical protein [Mycobacterium sp. MMS18-G62]
MTIDIDKKALSVVVGGLGVVAALIFASPASADTVIPLPPPAPADPVAAAPLVPLPPPAPADPAAAAPAAAAPAPQDTTVQAAGTDPATPPDGVPHLPSPENLPPGTTETPVDPAQPRLGYLRDLWHAVQTQEVSGKDALLLLTQRPMNANAAPPPGMPANPTPPIPLEAAPTP